MRRSAANATDSEVGPLEVLIAVLLAVGVLIYFGLSANRRGREMRDQAKAELSGTPTTADVDLTQPARPRVALFRIDDDSAYVTFDVPLADGPVDDVLRDLLVTEAVEVLRDEAPGREIAQVHQVVAMAGRGEVREVGRRSIDSPGELPPSLGYGHLLHFSKFALDPIEGSFESAADVSTHVAPSGSDQLGPIGDEIRLPKAVDVGLRTRGLDPRTMKAGEFVLTLLELFDYDVSPGEIAGTYTASKTGQRTYIREEPHGAGDHPELDESVINQFMFDFSSSGADRGLLVTEKWGPFEIYEREKRQPRVRFITRERLQGFVDSLAVG